MNERSPLYSLNAKRVWVAGHNGMVGSALVKRLQHEGCIVLTAPRNEFDLRRQNDVESFFATSRPQAVFLAAARVGGIVANDRSPATFLYDNLLIAANVIEAARLSKVEKLLNLGSTCVYPKLASQPITEDALLSGPLEPTNQWYAVAKIAAIKLCDAYRRQYGSDFISAMPTNLYGPNDNFDLESSHVIPALIRKCVDAAEKKAPSLPVWGTGKATREFLYVEDAAEAIVLAAERLADSEPVNLGAGMEISIRELSEKIAALCGFRGALVWDPTKPDGQPRRSLEVSRAKNLLGWSAKTPLEEGLKRTIEWYRGKC